MAISNNKREFEKKKVQKKKDKQRRKEERKKNGTSSFEDMIAYVDENGNLCDTPPETDTRQEVDADSIEVSVPKREDEPIERPEGRVDFYNDEKGFGFIRSDNAAEKYFFHISNAPPDINIGDRVSFDVEKGNKGLNAEYIAYIK